MKILLIIAALMALSCSTNNVTPATSDGPVLADSQIKLEVTKEILPNGLRVLLYEDRRLPIVAYYTFFDVGGRYEMAGLTGATHFLEHMMFKGTHKFPQGQFDGIIESNGGSTNAYTTNDSTVYYQTFPSLILDQIIELEADRMADILLDKESLEKERDVILEERKMRFENSPEGKLYMESMKAIFAGTPYGLSVIGESEDVKGLTRENLLKFHKDFYSPNNAILVIAGDIDPKKTMESIKRLYGPLKSSPGIAQLKKQMDDPSRFTFRSQLGRDIELEGTNPNHMFIATFQGQAQGSRTALILDMLSSILGDGNSSYFAAKYVKNSKPVLSNVYTSNYTLKNNGTFMVGGELLSNSSLSKVRASLKQDFLSLCSRSIDERNLQKTKNQYMKYYYDAIKTNDGIAKFLGSNENVYGDYAHYKQELEIYNSITVDEVKGACLDIFTKQRPIFVSIGPKRSNSKKR